MNEEIRVGDVVYDYRKNLVAVFSHGSWCHKRDSRGGVELVPVEAAIAKQYSDMPDALVISMGDFDKRIVNVAHGIIDSVSTASSQRKNLITDAVNDGVTRGLKKFGPFDPNAEKRDLDASIRKSIVNVMVYCCMKMMITPKGKPGYGILKDTFIRCADCWMWMREGTG